MTCAIHQKDYKYQKYFVHISPASAIGWWAVHDCLRKETCSMRWDTKIYSCISLLLLMLESSATRLKFVQVPKKFVGVGKQREVIWEGQREADCFLSFGFEKSLPWVLDRWLKKMLGAYPALPVSGVFNLGRHVWSPKARARKLWCEAPWLREYRIHE